MKSLSPTKIASMFLKQRDRGYLGLPEAPESFERLLREIVEDSENEEPIQNLERRLEREGRKNWANMKPIAEKLFQLGYRSLTQQSGWFLGKHKEFLDALKSVNEYGVSVGEYVDKEFSRWIIEQTTINLVRAISSIEGYRWISAKIARGGSSVIFFSKPQPYNIYGKIQNYHYVGEIAHTNKYKMLPKEIDLIKKHFPRLRIS